MASASFDHLYDDMLDQRLKPRLLQDLLRNHLPSQDDGDDAGDSVDLQRVVDAVKNFKLLSEDFSVETCFSRFTKEWTAAVDAWCNRLLALIQHSSRTKRCWIATCLMGLTCEECSSDRFVASYSAWVDVVLSNIDQPSEFTAVRAASCAIIANLLTRLGRYPNLKEVATLHTESVIQPVLELLDEDRSEAVLEEAVGLLCSIMNFFLEVIQHNRDKIEAAIFSKVVWQQCSSNMSKIYAHCVALLPKTRGDEESWHTLMQDLLTSIDIRLNELFLHLEEENVKFCKATGLLVQPGTDPLSTKEDRSVPGEMSIQETKRSKQLLITTVHTLMLSSCSMLTNHYPVEVTVPVDKLFKLVDRVLKVKYSYSEDTLPVIVIMMLELMWTELPRLHSHSLDLLTAMIRGVCSQLVPFSEHFIGLLKTYFRACTLPDLRIKVYSVTRSFLTSMGVGASLQLAEDVMSNAIVDLDYAGNRSRKELNSANSEPGVTKVSLQPGYQKRNHACIKEGLLNNLTSYGLKIAALEALETLLTVDGELEHLRADVGSLIINVAIDADEGKSAGKEATDFVQSSDPAWADFILASFRALLAFVLSQANVDPFWLSQGLELFHKGRGDAKKIDEFCAHALLVLEALVHPREIFPDIPHESQDSSVEEVDVLPQNIIAGCHENKDLIPTPIGIDDSSNEDGELIDPLLETGKETEKPSKAYHNAAFPRNNKPAVQDNAEKAKRGELMPDEDVKPFAGSSAGRGIGFGKVSSDSDELDPDSYNIKPSKDVLAIPEAVKKEENKSAATPITVSVKTEPVTGSGTESYMDSDDSKSDNQ